MVDTTVVYTTDFLNDDKVNATVHSNVAIKANGTSEVVSIGNSEHIEILVYVGTATGSPTIQFFLDVIDSTHTIKTYSGSILSATGADYITVDGLTLGTSVQLRWSGTLDGSNYFSGCYTRILVK